MCDCLQEDRTKTPETVTLFRKYPKPFSPGKDIVGNTLYRAVQDKDEGKAINLQPDSNDTLDTQKSSSCTEYSSDSSRVYKFVSPRKRFEEAEAKLPRISYESCEEETETADIEYTLAIIKPEAMMYRKEIEQRIFEEGFEICQTRWLQLTPEQVSEFYAQNREELNFPHLVAYMSSAPILVFVLAKRKAIKDWRMTMGPTKVTEARLYFPDSIRGRYGRRGEDFKNAVHGSANREEAEKEIHFFFPDFVVEPLLRGESVSDYLWDVINPILVEGLSLVRSQDQNLYHAIQNVFFE